MVHQSSRWLAGLCLLVVVASGAPTALAQEEFSGRISAEEYARLHEEAKDQESDAKAAFVARARTLGYSEAEIERALQPAMVRRGHLDVTLEDGTTVRFPWFRTGFAENSIANTDKEILRDAEGRAIRSETNKGGVRLHKGVFAEEVYALALKMDAKLAITGDAADGQSFRGAKGGIGTGRVVRAGSRYGLAVGDFVDPAAREVDRAAIMRGFARGYLESGGRVGLGYDIHAGDVNTKAAEMRVLSDAYERPGRPSAGVSGKDVLLLENGEVNPRGGIGYRATSTGEGVWMAARLAAETEKLDLDRATVGAQGWGEVGRAFGLAAVRDGAKLIAIQELWKVGGEMVPGLLVHPKGERATAAEVREWLGQVEELRRSGGDLRSFEGGRLHEHFRRGLEVSSVKLDIVGYNAMGGSLNERTVPELARSGTTAGRRKIVVEGANLAETAAGAEALDRLSRRIVTIPGDLANLGGVHVSNLEGIQNSWLTEVSDEAARRSLEETMRSGWDRARALARERGVSERVAIELLAVEEAMRRSLQRENATRNSLEARVVSPEALARGRTRAPVEGMTHRLRGGIVESPGDRGVAPERAAGVGAHALAAEVASAGIGELVRAAFPASHPLARSGELTVEVVRSNEAGVEAPPTAGSLRLRVSTRTLDLLADASLDLDDAEARSFRARALLLLSLEAADRATSMDLDLEGAIRRSGVFGDAGLSEVEVSRLRSRLGRVGLDLSPEVARRLEAGRSSRRGSGLLPEDHARENLRRIRERARGGRRARGAR